jgi:hypothetical protein
MDVHALQTVHCRDRGLTRPQHTNVAGGDLGNTIISTFYLSRWRERSIFLSHR